MGTTVNITCRNKDCRYHVLLREGESMGSFKQMRYLERDILNGDESAPQVIMDLLAAGKHLRSSGIYLCPSCQEWQNMQCVHLFESLKVSPYGTVREYRIHYLDGAPKCEKCGGELVFILNPCSSKQHCPKCGCDNMIVRGGGTFD